MNKLDLNNSVYDLCTKYPELKGILYNLGFQNVMNQKVLETAGRVMTIPKGCRVKKISLELVTNQLKRQGFEVIGEVDII